MGYLKIPNLYKNQDILEFKWVYALEKIHGTSARVSWDGTKIDFFSGGERHDNFCALFNYAYLENKFQELGHSEIVVFGEAYGGKCQGMSHTYGKSLRFIAFEVKIGLTWLDVPNAKQVAERLGFDFVPYAVVPTDLAAIDVERDKPSETAKKLGLGDRPREGVVLRPPFEVVLNHGERLLVKHKADAFKETATPREVSADKAQLLQNAQVIAAEWVTPMRLNHVIDGLIASNKLNQDYGIQATGIVTKAMIQDVVTEGQGEIELSHEALKAIGSASARIFKEHLAITVNNK